MSSTHLAARQPRPGQPLEIGPIPTPVPQAGQILIRNAAIGINPIDGILQDEAIFPWLSYPAILGSDVAGVVVAVGDGVYLFKPGDRVIGQAVGTSVDDPGQGAFQENTIVRDHMAAPIPDALSFVDAAVLPLGLGTAASGLYGKDQLALSHPTRPVTEGGVVLVWGASSSVGCNAVQLAAASGYVCIAVASDRHAGMLERLGASAVIDRNGADVAGGIARMMGGKRLAGALHATGDIRECLRAVSLCDGTRTVAATLPPPDDLPEGVRVTHISGTSLKDDEVGPMLYRDFLPQALAEGRFVPAPPARVAGSGLAALQDAIRQQQAGVSAQKIVVTLP